MANNNFLLELAGLDKSRLKHVEEIKVTTITGHTFAEERGGDGVLKEKNFVKDEKLPEWDYDSDGIPRLAYVTAGEAHGSLGDAAWRKPVLVADSKGLDARPGYNTLRADEFEDESDVLDKKIKLLARLIKRSKHCVAYTGAGISTSAGVPDYATRAKGSAAADQNKDLYKKMKMKPWEMLKAQPTYSHRSLAALSDAGFVKGWIQQNHDGLPQKAGYAQSKLNEIHGGWQDPSNPVVSMSGTLRSDLCRDLDEHCKKTDLCLTLGTSLAGMSADRIAIITGKNSQKQKDIIGTVIISLQRTPHDKLSCLRIYAKLDDVFQKLMKYLRVEPNPELEANEWSENYYGIPAGLDENKLVFNIPYKEDGTKATRGVFQKKQRMMVLDMRPGQMLRITDGPNCNDLAKVIHRDEEGNFEVELQRTGIRHKYGIWWISEAIKGTGKRIPLVNVDPQYTS